MQNFDSMTALMNSEFSSREELAEQDKFERYAKRVEKHLGRKLTQIEYQFDVNEFYFCIGMSPGEAAEEIANPGAVLEPVPFHSRTAGGIIISNG